MAPLEEIVCDQDLEDHPAVSHFVGMVLLGDLSALCRLNLHPNRAIMRFVVRNT